MWCQRRRRPAAPKGWPACRARGAVLNGRAPPEKVPSPLAREIAASGTGETESSGWANSSTRGAGAAPRLGRGGSVRRSPARRGAPDAEPQPPGGDPGGVPQAGHVRCVRPPQPQEQAARGGGSGSFSRRVQAWRTLSASAAILEDDPLRVDAQQLMIFILDGPTGVMVRSFYHRPTAFPVRLRHRALLLPGGARNTAQAAAAAFVPVERPRGVRKFGRTSQTFDLQARPSLRTPQGVSGGVSGPRGSLDVADDEARHLEAGEPSLDLVGAALLEPACLFVGTHDDHDLIGFEVAQRVLRGG